MFLDSDLKWRNLNALIKRGFLSLSLKICSIVLHGGKSFHLKGSRDFTDIFLFFWKERVVMKEENE